VIDLPRFVRKGSALHWVGRLAVYTIAALLVARAATQWTNSGVGLLADAFILAIAVSGVNLITGYTGQLSLGHSAFFAIGAYTSLILTDGRIPTPFLDDDSWPPGLTIPAAAVVCFVIGALVGLPALRLRGIYLALVTLVFVEATRAMLKYDEFAGVTGGAAGIKGERYVPPEWTPFDGRADLNKWFLWLSLAFLILIGFGTSNLIRTRIGRAMVATRDNETAAAVMGVHLASVKTITFGLSGAITGIAGSLFGLKLGLVDPDVPFFGLIGAITFLVAMFVGGAAQSWGPVVGAVFYVFVTDFARGVGEDPDGSLLLGWLVGEDTKLNGLGGLIFGVLLILFARFAPLGAVGTYKHARAHVVQVVPVPPDLGDTAPRNAPAGAAPSGAQPAVDTSTDPDGPD
jgi:branched-chain amino acid transport system permease protein